MQASAQGPSPRPANPRFTGTPLVRSWSSEDYGGTPVCQAVLQHPTTGFIYLGSNGGLLEFDGARWRTVAGIESQVRTLTLDRRGRIWFVTAERLGCVEPDATGEWRVVSAMPRLPPAENSLRIAVGTLAADGGVYCGTRRTLYFLNDSDTSPAQVWPLPAPLLTMWLADGMTHLALQNGAWLRVRAGKLEAIEARAPEVLAVAGEMLLTAHGPVPAAAGDFADGDTANAAIVLADGRLAFGMERGGLIICDRTGRVIQRIDRALGLLSNRVHGLCEDREGGVWLALHRGLARVQLDTPFAVHGPAQRFDSTPVAVQRVAGRLIVAHAEGLAEIGPDGIFTPVRTLPVAPAEALAGLSTSFTAAVLQRALPQGVAAPAADRTPYTGALELASEPGVFAVGSYDGVWLCRANGANWDRIGKVRGTEGYHSVAIEAPAGFVWDIIEKRGLSRIDLRPGARVDAPVRAYGRAEGLPSDRASGAMFRLGGSVDFFTESRLLRYDVSTDRFEPETRIENLPVLTAGGLVGGANINEDADGTLWLLLGPSGRRIVRVTPTGVNRWRAEALDTTLLGQQRIAAVFHDAVTESLWLSARNGALISMDLNGRSTRPPVPLAATVRRVETLAGGLISGGASSHPGVIPLAATQTGLRFLFAAPQFLPGPEGVAGRMNYRTRLDGLESEWTPWSTETYREFTNLPWRALKFRVQARDHLGRESAEDTLAFSIAAPWWATKPSFAAYALLSVFLIGGLVRLRTRSLHARAERLEAIVAARTAELGTKNIELTRLHKLELDEKTAARLAEEKTRLEMLRYQLNPHFLANSLAALRTLVGPSATGAREMIERLAAFCRMALTRRDDAGTVREEIEMLRAYLDTERGRWREMLEIKIDAPDAVLDRQLPPFLLLPLVENAIKFGGRTSPDVLRVHMTFAPAGTEGLVVTIANTGRWLTPAETADSPESTHIGIDNIRQRLLRHYPDAHEFTTAAADGWVVVTLKIGHRLGLIENRKS
jgi:hypothetical protein